MLSVDSVVAAPEKFRSSFRASWRDPEPRKFKTSGYRLEFILSIEGPV